jgi:tetratricopeptide (TPR) repeat protein
VLALAQAQAANQDLKGARETLRAGLGLAPQSLPLRAALGMVELRLGNGEEALRLARALEQEFPAQAIGFRLEGEMNLAARRYDAAADSFATAFGRQPTWDLLTRELLALHLAERSEEIEPKLERWIESHPDETAAHLALAEELQTQGRGAQALAEYQRVLAADKDQPIALNNAAWLLYEAGDPGALELAQRAYRLAPKNASVLDTLGWILVETKREQEGLEYLRQADTLAPEVPEIRYHVAQTQARLGRNAEARSTLEKLLAADGTFADRAQAEALLESL